MSRPGPLDNKECLRRLREKKGGGGKVSGFSCRPNRLKKDFGFVFYFLGLWDI